MKRLIWSKEDDNFLRENFLKMTREEMAKSLNIRFWSVYRRLRKLGLKRNRAFRESLIGQRFGKLVVIRFIKTKNKRSFFEVHCDCGIVKTIVHCQLTSGNTKSCGCLRFDGLEERQYRAYYRSYKHSAKARSKKKKKNVPFKISFDFFVKMIALDCHYCGEKPRRMDHPSKGKHSAFKDAHIMGNGIDRLDSDKGYIEGNCVPCCPTCNWFKNNYEYDNFLEMIIKIYNYRNLKDRA